MKALGDAALELAWLSPCVASLTTLTRGCCADRWPELRCDVGFALLLAAAQGPRQDETKLGPRLTQRMLEAALTRLESKGGGFVDWNQPGPDLVYRAAVRQAQLAAALARKVGGDPDSAWLGGLLAPLGWLALTVVDPAGIGRQVQELRSNRDVRAWQQECWGLDHGALARRLARQWRLPDWLSSCAGQLSLHVSVAARLGADPILFQTVQLAVLLFQHHRPGLALQVGSDVVELLDALGLDAGEVEDLSWQVLGGDVPVQPWEAPAQEPLLIELVRMAVDRRRSLDDGMVEGLQRDLDRLQDVLERRAADEKTRLQTLKLSALAEFAAGAGHEINNPLAVISGQAQYIHKQLQRLEGPSDEIDDVGAYLEHLRGCVYPSLHKIIGQTQRIHGILTGLMHFARPAPPKPQPVELSALLRQVADSLAGLASERGVRLSAPEITGGVIVEVDQGQLRVALGCLLRNAIEAAPRDGWAGLRLEQSGPNLEILVEDNGPGPCAAVREHLFDPFFSGRSAGRGRGLGLPTAWRLARQQGGDVRFDGRPEALTRFVLSLPAHLVSDGAGALAASPSKANSAA